MKFAVTGARLIDGTGNGVIPDAAMLIVDGRIERIVAGGGADMVRSADTRLDLEGRSVVPGLFNCHVHLYMNAGTQPLVDLAEEPTGLSVLIAAARARRMLGNGITTVRDCGAKDLEILHLRRAVADGHIAGPRILSCGRAICSAHGHAKVLSAPVHDADEVARVAKNQLAAGTDFVKLMATGGFGKDGEDLDKCELTEEEIRAAVHIAHGARKRVAVHAYGNQGIRNAVLAGTDTVEHCAFPEDDTIVLMLERDTSAVPTLTNTFKVSTQGGDWGVTPYIVETASRVYPEMLSRARRMLEMGLRMGVGTDAGSWLNPHEDIVTELQIRVELGASPVEAIRMGTLDSAACLGLEHEVGSLQEGKTADFVVLDGDPAEDIAALRSVHEVYRNGRAVGATACRDG